MSLHSRFRHASGQLLMAAAVALSACESGEPAPPFEVAGTGSLEGFLFFDANGDGLFDPSAGDRALNNVHLSLRERNTSSVIAGSTATTDSNGRFVLSGLPVGTHDLVIDTTGVGAGTAFCQNPLPVDIHLNETQFSEVAARAGCVISIADAEKKAAGSVVTVAGIVTARPNQISASSGYWYIEDATGGTQLFGIALGGHTIAVGDSVEVTGTLSLFSGELEISNGQVNSYAAAVRQIQPVTVTTKQAADASDPTANLQGRLIKISKARQTSEFSAGGGRNATFDDGSGAITVRIESALVPTAGDVATTYPLTTPGKCYDITGILRDFSTGAQLTPRSLTEIVEVACQ